MRTAADILGARVKALPSVERRTAVFVGMVGNLAQVNAGGAPILVPCVGFTVPIPGMVVQLERQNGQYVVTGPAVAQTPIGVISGTGSPQAQVTVAGVAYPLYYNSNYAPTLGDTVVIDWPAQMITGKVTGSTSGTTPDTTSGGPADVLPGDPVLAFDSGQYRSRWQANDVRASDTVSGAWFYNGRVAAALAGATVTRAWIYLPLRQQLGVCNIGTHPYSTIPGGSTGISSSTALSPRGGWVDIPLSFIGALAASGGIAVTSGNGDNQWSGTQADALSGALRFQGTR